MRFERQPGRPLDRRSRRATHDSQGPPWCRCSSPCRREPLPRDAVRRSILAPPPARGSGDTPPVWSDRVARSVVGRGPRPPVQLQFERQTRQPLDRRSRRATHDSQGPPWCRCSSPCRREPLPLAARRSILAPPPARGSGDTPPVWSDRVARSVVGRGPRPPVQLQFERQTRQPLDRRSRRATHDSQGPPWCRCSSPCRREPLPAPARRRAPLDSRTASGSGPSGGVTRPRCGATELLAPWLVEDRDRRCSCSSSVRPDSHSTADPDEPPTTPRGRPGAVAVRRAGVSRSRWPCAVRLSRRLRLGGAATRPRCGATELLRRLAAAPGRLARSWVARRVP
jgi:hypothetical protein